MTITNKNKLKCASFFAGVGGIDLGFEQTKCFEVVYANEFDPMAVKTYEANSNIKVDYKDIKTVKSSDIPDFDVLLGGFPCQAFSVAGKREGFDDKKGRGNLFFEILRIIQDKRPSIVFLENVKNLVRHDDGKTFRVILESLKAEKYHVKYMVMNTMHYGNTPQNRERVYIVAFRSEGESKNFNFPDPIKLKRKIKDIVKYNLKVEAKYYYTTKFPHYDKLRTNVINRDSVYQWRRKYVRENKSGVCPTLTANMGTGGHNVPLVKTKHGVRKLTPKECFEFQGFPKDFILPETTKNGPLYKQAGNSVSVTVITRIAEQIIKALNTYDNLETVLAS